MRTAGRLKTVRGREKQWQLLFLHHTFQWKNGAGPALPVVLRRQTCSSCLRHGTSQSHCHLVLECCNVMLRDCSIKSCMSFHYVFFSFTYLLFSRENDGEFRWLLCANVKFPLSYSIVGMVMIILVSGMRLLRDNESQSCCTSVVMVIQYAIDDDNQWVHSINHI